MRILRRGLDHQRDGFRASGIATSFGEFSSVPTFLEKFLNARRCGRAHDARAGTLPVLV